MQSWQRRGAKGQGSQICRLVLENRYTLTPDGILAMSGIWGFGDLGI
ncbi:MAG: hypothetical protein ACFB0G_02715 [Leptolyngbyaceae cyanobacterium]